MSVTVDIKNYDEVIQQLRDHPKQLAKGVRGITLGMVKRNGKGGSSITAIASKHARKVYSISKSEFDARTDYRYDETGSISLSGVEIPFFAAEITSSPDRTFTPIHFGMDPAVRPSKRGYTVTWKPGKSGSKRQLRPLRKYAGQPVFLASANGSPVLPWVRIGERHKPIEAVRTHLSPPQMTDNPKVQPQIQKEIEERIEKKLDNLVSKMNSPS